MSDGKLAVLPAGRYRIAITAQTEPPMIVEFPEDTYVLGASHLVLGPASSPGLHVPANRHGSGPARFAFVLITATPVKAD